MSEKQKDRIWPRVLNVLYFGIGFPLMWWVVQSSLINLNNEIIIENWAIGLIGISISSILYIAPPYLNFLLRLKKIHFFFIGFFLSWFLADLNDFLIIIGGYLL